MKPLLVLFVSAQITGMLWGDTTIPKTSLGRKDLPPLVVPHVADFQPFDHGTFVWML